MLDRLKDKVRLINGGESGLGKATNHHLAEAGVHICVCDVNRLDPQCVRGAANPEEPPS